MSTEPRKVRFAVVGAGNIAQEAVLPAFEHARGAAELAAIVSGDPEKRAELGRLYGVARTVSYDDYDRLLASGDVDAVYLALPNTMHRAFAERAARAGVHVLCEKPMAMTVEDCEAMIRAADEGDVKLMIAYRLHFEEANLNSVEIVRSGGIGEPRAMTAMFTQTTRPGDIRTRGDVGGGALYDLGVYCVNAARYLFRDEPIEVFGATTVRRDDRFSGVDETAAALLRFPGERTAQLTVSQALAPTSCYRVVGSCGELSLEPAFDYEVDLVQRLTVGERTQVTRFPRRDQFAPELIYFARCILDGEEPEPSGEEGLADVRVLAAIQRSAASGQPVALPPFRRRSRPDLSLEMHKPPVEKREPVHAPAPTSG